ncbi:MAG: glycosyltransferase family 4 protein [Acidobacteriia bacterium]|nr:glycosyltransferase family 4 protein [Terriglobia bacterium]
MKKGEDSRRALVVAYDFPPRRTSAVYRVTNLTKYLKGYGWLPTVLTVEQREGDLEDPTVLAGFPSHIPIERTKDLDISGWEDRAAAGIRATGGLKSHYKDVRQPLRDRWVRSMGDFLRSCLYFPDKTLGWVPGGFARAAELHLQRRFELVYTTSPPRSTPVVGLLLKALFGVPWVLELMDPWYPPKRPIRRRAERWLLGCMLRRADRVVLISKGLASELERSYGLPARKLAVVSSGYEESDFEQADGRPCDFLPAQYFHFSHFGTVYPGFGGRFYDALADLLRECPELREKIRVNIIGSPDDVAREHSKAGSLEGVLKLHNFVRHDVAIDAMRRSDVLLVFLGHRDVARLSGLGKIYDYLRVGRPVLAIAYEGGTAELVREGQAGWVVDPEDMEGIKRTLRKILDDGRRSEPPRPFRPEFVEQFRYDRLAEKLASVFDSVLSHGA